MSYAYDQQTDGYRTDKKLVGKDGTVLSTTSYLNDQAVQLKSVTNPLGKITRYTYDANGNVSDVTSPDSSIIGHLYDGPNRLTDVIYNGKTRYKFTLDENGNKKQIADLALNQTQSQGFDKANHLFLSSSANGSINWSYDSNNNLKNKKITNGSTTITHTYAYNNINQNTLVTDAVATTASITAIRQPPDDGHGQRSRQLLRLR